MSDKRKRNRWRAHSFEARIHAANLEQFGKGNGGFCVGTGQAFVVNDAGKWVPIGEVKTASINFVPDKPKQTRVRWERVTELPTITLKLPPDPQLKKLILDHFQIHES